MKPTPSRHKMAFLTWLAVYPLITAIFYFFSEELMAMPLLLRTLVLTIIMVLMLSYVFMPTLSKRLKNWLHK